MKYLNIFAGLRAAFMLLVAFALILSALGSKVGRAILEFALEPIWRYHNRYFAMYVYNGATAASSLANPPLRIAGGMGGVNTVSTPTGGGRSVWLYNSSNGTTELSSGTFFSDGYYLGMKQGDLIMGVSNTGSSSQCFLGVISSVSTLGCHVGGAAGTSTNAMITSTH